jgi:hypothetical protein
MAREPREPDVKFTVPADLTIADIKKVLEEITAAKVAAGKDPNLPDFVPCGGYISMTRRTTIIDLDDEV